MNIILSTISALRNPKESARITLFLLAQELRRQGHNVRVIAKCYKKGEGEDLTAEDQSKDAIQGIPLYRTSSLVKIPLLLYRLHQDKKIDIVHSFSASPLFFLPHLAAPGKKIHTLKSYSRSVYGRRGYSMLAFADRVTVPTRQFARKIPLTKRVNVVYSPIDTAKFFPKNKAALKEKYGYQQSKILLYYGALWHEKGVDVLLESMPQVIQRFPQIKLLILPRYANIRAQEEQIQQLALESYVQFITQDVSIEDYVNLADVVVLPYRSLFGTEGNPSCLLEAMACKKPVVTTNLPELREIAEGGVLFAEPGNAASLSTQIISSLENDMTTMVERADESSKQFDVKEITKKFLGIYEEVLGKGLSIEDK